MIRSLLLFFVIFFPIILFAQDELTAEQKLEQLTKQIIESPDNLVLYNNRADAYLQLNDLASAMADLNKVVELYKASPAEKEKEVVAVAYYKLSETKLKDGEADLALKHVSSAIKLVPNEKTYLLHEARIYGTMPDKYDMAEQKFDGLVSKFGDDEAILLEYGKFLLNNDPNKAVVLFEKVLRLNVMNKKALNALGGHFTKAAEQQSDKSMASTYRDKAIGYFELLFTIDPETEGLKASLRKLYTTQGRTADLEKLK